MLSSRCAGACVLLLALKCLGQSNSPGRPVLDLSLEKAIAIAISSPGNANIQIAQETEQLAHSRYTNARADLLPTLDGSVAEQNLTVNPRAMGLRFESPLFTVPNEVGPFSTFDARLRLNQNILNLSAIRHWQAARQDIQSAKSETDSVREHVAGTVARLYAGVLRADSQIAVSKANIADAEALRDLASHRASAGEGTELDVARANLNVAREQQRMLAAEADRTRTQLDLIKLLNLDWNTVLSLTGKLDDVHPEALSVEQAMTIALKSRADFKLQQNRIESAKLNYRAAKLERLPSVAGYADYGVLEGVQTHTVGAALRLPLFDGGRIESDRLEAASLMRQQQIHQAEIKSQIELDVRKALAILGSAQQQIRVSEQAVALAQEEVARSRRRYNAGIANSLEVIDAQTQVEIARDDRVAALFNYASACIGLAQATGTVAKMVF